ncbi:MAG TPA: phosphate signaling complex protein PhoU [Methanosarcinaceae archaeon]|nr:phosphate signaling complex protein PhoU [Methanosarcinaceae archaeon]
MVRDEYHEELAGLEQMVSSLGEMAGTAIRCSVEALRDHNIEQAEIVIKGDETIDELSAGIETTCMRLLALQQPMARDLRMIGATIKINLDLERMSDLAVDIAKIAVAMGDEKHVKPLVDIPRMASISCEMVEGGLQAYTESNSDLAYATAKRDDEIDALFDQVRRELITLMVEYPTRITNASHLTFVARYLERIGDHASNVCESVVYMVTGERVKLN